MTEPDDDTIVVRSVTVSEVMDTDGNVRLDVQSEGMPELWTMLGMLAAGIRSVQLDLDATWYVSDEDDE